MKKILLILLGLFLFASFSLNGQHTYKKSTNTVELEGLASKIKLNGATSGSSILEASAVAGSTTITLPATTGTVARVEDVADSMAARIAAGQLAVSLVNYDDGIYNSIQSTGTITAGTGITAAMLSRFMYYSGASAVDITADPQIANGTTGQIITIIGSSDSNTLTLDDGTGLRLTGQCVLGISDNITLLYEGTIGDWIEISRSNN